MQVSADNSAEARERETPFESASSALSSVASRETALRARRYDAMRYLVIACTGFCSLETRREVPSEIRGHSCLNKMKKRSRRRRGREGERGEEGEWEDVAWIKGGKGSGKRDKAK